LVAAASSPPMWMNGPGVSRASSPTTSETNSYVTGLSMQSVLKPTSIPVWSGVAFPSQESSGYDDRAAWTCPGISISGTTSTYRAAA
jgi:hypothetical protein